MTNYRSIRPLPPLEIVLAANASRARLFERDPDNNAMRETASFVHPQSRLKGQSLGRDRPGQAYKGEARTAFEPHTDPHQKEHVEFARELAQRLEVLGLARRYASLLVFASNPFLGELMAQFGDATHRLLHASLALDLTAFDDGELEYRVSKALKTAESAVPVAAH